MTQIKQGDIIIANLNPKQGHEQQGFRPLLVLSNDIVDQYSNVVIVAPISSTERRLPLYIDLPKNLKTNGVVLLDQLTTIDYRARGQKSRSGIEGIFTRSFRCGSTNLQDLKKSY